MRRKTSKLFQLQSTRGVDYRLLGLPQGESDVVRIRGSVTKSSRLKQTRRSKFTVHEAHSNSATVESSQATNDRLLKVTLAGYRLLDPRFRRELYDRVQLSYIVYRELDEKPEDSQRATRIPLLQQNAAPIETQLDKPVEKPVENALRGDKGDVVSSSNNTPMLDSLAVPSNSESLAIDSPISDARDIVRMIQASDTRTKLDAATSTHAVSRWIHSAVHATLQVAASVGRKTLAAAFQGTGSWYVTPVDADEKLNEEKNR